jgi:hypothetical protein
MLPQANQNLIQTPVQIFMAHLAVRNIHNLLTVAEPTLKLQ